MGGAEGRPFRADYDVLLLPTNMLKQESMLRRRLYSKRWSPRDEGALLLIGITHTLKSIENYTNHALSRKSSARDDRRNQQRSHTLIHIHHKNGIRATFRFRKGHNQMRWLRHCHEH